MYSIRVLHSFKSISEDNINKIKKNVVSILGKNVPFNNEIKLVEEKRKSH